MAEHETPDRLRVWMSWALLAFLGVTLIYNLIEQQFLWALFTATVIGASIVTPLKERSIAHVIPPDILAVASLPVIGRSVANVALTSQLATYLSVAALALIIVTGLHLYTPVEMSSQFAVLFVVITTMAVAGVWAWTRWISDIYLHTALLPGALDDPKTEHLVMWEFVYSTVAGLLAGLLLPIRFRRWGSVVTNEPQTGGEL